MKLGCSYSLLRTAILFIFLATALTTSVSLACGADARPNTLFIMSDDHAAHATSAYGYGKPDT